MKTAHQTSAVPLSFAENATWKTGQVIAWITTLAVVAGLFFQPELTLKIAWYAVVPLLPASFLINAGLWRALCPLATANTLPSRKTGRVLTGTWLRRSSAVGLILLMVLVPLRRLLLNQDGPALAMVLLAIVVLALISGVFFQVKGGFCNSICPVLPVEKLYGQSPLLSVRNPRCVPCTHCTTKGCIDIDPGLSIRQAMGSGTTTKEWLKTPFGIFAAAFPGFIFGYFQVEDVPLTEIAAVYGQILSYALVSFVVVSVISSVLKIGTELIAPVSGALSIAIYYWFAAPASFEAFNVPGGELARWGMLIVITVWFAKAYTKASHTGKKGGGSRSFNEPMRAVPVKPLIH